MKQTFFAISCLLVNVICHAQITVDTTRTMVMVKEKAGATNRALNIYRIFVPGQGTCHKITYQPDNTIEIGDEPPGMRMTFASESTHIKAMLDAAMRINKQYNFASISFNVTPYTDLVNKLATAYETSPDWNAYLRRTGDSLYVTTVLWDGNEVREIAYNQQVAARVLDNNDMVKAINNLMLPYGYQVKGIEFLTDHPEILRPDQLQLLNKNGNLIVPVPHNFTLRKVK